MALSLLLHGKEMTEKGKFTFGNWYPFSRGLLQDW